MPPDKDYPPPSPDKDANAPVPRATFDELKTRVARLETALGLHTHDYVTTRNKMFDQTCQTSAANLDE